MTPDQIAEAWHSVEDRWIVRRNKMHDDGRQWEVIHDFGGQVVSEDTMTLKGRFPSSDEAEEVSEQLEDRTRGAAVLAALKRSEDKA